MEKDGKVIGFIVGFLSHTRQTEAYIHFVGIHPSCRKQDLGKQIYQQFIQAVTQKGCKIIRCVTSPVNKGSIAFHAKWVLG
ncbi:GNAT family N-acetyltransferase [Fictibacillus sp. NRS-1165]